jgi:hypothetical protein
MPVLAPVTTKHLPDWSGTSVSVNPLDLDEAGRGGEQHPVSGFDGLQSEADPQVRLAYAWWPQHDDVVAVLDEVAAGQLLHQLAVDRWLVAEVEGLQRLDEGEPCHGGAHGDVLAGLGRHLLAEHLLEELGVRQVVSSSLLQQRFEPLAALEQAQLPQVLAQAF